jgi:hypothetical protein
MARFEKLKKMAQSVSKEKEKVVPKATGLDEMMKKREAKAAMK